MNKTNVKSIYIKHLLLLTVSVVSFSSCAEGNPPDRGNGPKPPTFSELDADGDGYVTLTEFSAMGAPPHGSASDIFNEIDANSDGQITEQEMKSHRPSRPQRDN